MRSRIKVIFLIGAVVAALLYGGLFWFLRNPILPSSGTEMAQGADPVRLKAHVESLAAIKPPRNAQNLDGLNQAAAHVAGGFAGTGCRPEEQRFVVNHSDYKNLVCSFGPDAGPRVVIGAHYDVSGDDNPGADDNASGVAGLLELARLIGTAGPRLAHRLDLVAFALEEPPHFHSAEMGSHFYARRLSDAGVPVKLMVSVEMIGYFSDQLGSQDYPLGFLSWFYPERGNFIAVVGQGFERRLVARVKELMSLPSDLPVYSINAPGLVPGIDFSDHWSFWQFGFPAVMVTDTAYLRNPNYHSASDRPATLDYRRMAKTVDGLYQVAVGF